MDEKLARKLSRQLRLLNIMVSFFGIITLAGLALLGFALWQMIIFAQDIGNRVESFQTQTTEQFDVRSQACDDASLGAFLKNNTDVCR